MITMTTTTDLPASPLKDFLTGALHMTPLNLAVVPWAILAGSMAVDSGLTFAQSVAMSAMVFAGAAQLVTLGLLNSGAGVITIIVSVFFITSQHLLYGLTLRPHVRPFSPLQRAGIGFLLTDELFAVSVAGRQRLSFAYLFGAGLSFYLVWVLVSILGIVLAHSISDLSRLRLDFSVVATLLAIVVPLIKSKSALVGALFSFVVTIILTRAGIQGSAVIAGVSAMLLAVLLGRKWGDVK
ncbi:AzlC family ABC transporter permease [Morganella morganii]|uniref:AzlC family ABC transporter permease n=3 Tax=Enterobacterales TaxID=91347 RepID=A0AAE4FAU0_MORMO|nr:AzlC family ABC transporter permease [Morganella morganii]AUU01335.1 branched-chain amino acid ABC transporter permease [Morganella morganii]AVD60005.1 branched-chain amino acid ABC transporter permease [Morganella morganii]EHZ6676941.1 AzlC family ABC transporter permease [Morganella morganii]EJG2204588.1 AzlC family ABC transporter permease [Morganella morganii]EKU8059990.1 AzlC family ABC transporter permease [Morganella morganii]